MTEAIDSWSKTAANNATADGAITWADTMSPDAVDNSARSMMAAIAKWRDDNWGQLVSTGSTNEYTITTNRGVPAHANGVGFAFRADKTSSGAATTTVDGLAQKSIFRADGTATQSGDIISGGMYILMYSSVAGGYIGLNIGSIAQAALDLKANLASPTFTGTVTARIGPRVVSTASAATPTPDSDATDVYIITAQTATAAFAAPTGTPTNGQRLIIRIKDNGTARAITWNAIYRAGDTALPTTTTISKTAYYVFLYNSTDTKWDYVSPATGF